MNKSELSYTYKKAMNPTPPEGSMAFGFVFLVIVFFGGIIFIPMILNDFWMIGFIATIMIGTYIRSHIVNTRVDREFFDNPDNHSHDDSCTTCGEIYGPRKGLALHPHLYDMAYVCRHASGEMKYPE